jgi:NAD(P)-dependent dehydrogenase (short-subunit alcohol dehydrogenase family)
MNMTMEGMEGKVALVTDASGGIGLATARQFTQAGAGVVLSARRTDPRGRRRHDRLIASRGTPLKASSAVTPRTKPEEPS